MVEKWAPTLFNAVKCNGMECREAGCKGVEEVR